MDLELRELSFGEIIGKSFNLLINNFPKLFLTTVISLSPYFIMMVFFLNQQYSSRLIFNASSSILTIVIGIVSFVIIMLGLAMMNRFTFDQYLGRQAAIGSVFRDSLNVMGKMIGFTLLSGLLSFAASFVFQILMRVLGINIVTILLAIAFLIGVIAVSLGFSCTIPVYVYEKERVVQGMKRSWHLTEGRRLHILGLFIVMGLIAFVAMLVFGLVGVVLGFLFTGSTINMVATTVIMMLGYSVMLPLFSNLIVVIYINQRIKDEGFSVEHLTEQFETSSIYNTDI